MSLGTFLRSRRTEHGLPLTAVAARVGMSPVRLSRLERDREPPPEEDVLVRLAEAIGVAPTDVLATARRRPSDDAPTAIYTAYRRPGGLR